MNTKNWTDDEIIRALRRGNPERRRAWEYMFTNWRGAWIGLVVQRGGTADEAEDALGDVAMPFERAVKAEGFHLERATLRTYLLTCILRAWAKRKGKALPVTGPVEEGHVQETADNVEKTIQRDDLKAAVDKLLGILGDRCKRVLRMFGQGDSMEKIAEAEGWKDAGKAKKEKYECQTKLKNHLREHPELANRLKELLYD